MLKAWEHDTQELILFKYPDSSYIKKTTYLLQRMFYFQQYLLTPYSKDLFHNLNTQLPIIPVVSIIKKRNVSSIDIKYKYVWGWRRERSSHIFLSKIISRKQSLEGMYVVLC